MQVEKFGFEREREREQEACCFRTWFNTAFETQYRVDYDAATVPAMPTEVIDNRLVEIHKVALAWIIRGCANVSWKRLKLYKNHVKSRYHPG